MRHLKILVFVCFVCIFALSPEATTDVTTATKATLDRLNKEGIDAYYAADYPTALEKWQAGLKQARALNDRLYISRFLTNIGRTLEPFEQSLAIHREIGDRRGEGDDLSNIGVVYENLGQYVWALEYYEQALTIIREIGDHLKEKDTLTNLGRVYWYLGQYERALKSFEQTLAIHREIGDRRGEGDDLSNIGMVYRNLGRYQEALEYYEQALAIHQEVGDRHGEGADLSGIGGVYTELEQYPLALEYYEQALAIRRESSDLRREGITLTNLGKVYEALGQYQRTLEYYEQALTIARKIGDHPRERDILTNLGKVSKNLGQYQRTLEYCEQALTIARKIGDHHRERDILTNIIGVCENLGQYQRALEYCEQALAIRREFGDPHGEGIDLTNLGIVYAEMGQYQQALEYCEQALAIHRESVDRYGEGVALSGIGVVYWHLGQYERALEYHEQALAIKREIGDRRGERVALSDIGKVYRYLGQYERALEYYEQALKFDREIGDRRREGMDLTGIGMVYRNLERYQEAYSALQNSIDIHKTIGNTEFLWRAQRGLASVEIHLYQFEFAITHYEQALDTIEVLRAGLMEKEHKLSFMRDKLYVYDELINLLQELHKEYPDKGYDCKALEIFERKQGRVFLEEMGKSGARLFTGLPELITQRELDLETHLDQTRKQLVDERAKSITEQNKELIQTLEKREKTLLSEQEALQTKIKTNYPDYYALRYPKPVALAELQRNVLQPSELVLVYGVMKKKTCLWVIGQEEFELYALDIGEDILAEKVAAFRETLHYEWGTGRGLVVDGQIEQKRVKQIPFVQLSHDLYTVIIPEAVRPLLTDQYTLTIVPTGPLYALPFEALVTSSPGSAGILPASVSPSPEASSAGKMPALPGNSVHYLIEDIPISYLSSASLLKTLREAQARRKPTAQYPLLAFAHPAYEPTPDPSQADSGLTENDTPLHPPQGGNEPTPGPSQEGNVSLRKLRNQSYRNFFGGDFAELPETEDEARAIADLLNAPKESDPLQLRKSASRANVLALNSKERLDNYHYLLFAMHGVLPGEVDQVTQSALVLSDDFLTMADVFGLQLNANLVSLSACNTGRGTQMKGEGVMGLTRAFMYAGTPVVAVTLWSVESLSAKDLDIGFFRHLKANLPTAKALQAIKVQMLRGEAGQDYRYPYYWAPFVVFGDGM